MPLGSIAPIGRHQFSDANGVPLAFGKLFTFLAGTATPSPIYTDGNLAVAHPNPVILDAGGYLTIYLGVVSQKWRLEDANGVVIWTVDPVTSTSLSSLGSTDVPGLAGELIAARDVVYLSQGDGGTTVGQWYRADRAQVYSSSSALVVGVAMTAIASGAVGTIRRSGQVTGFVGLTTGATYYVDSGGAITPSKPLLRVRPVGVADSTTTLVLNPDPWPGLLESDVQDCRLSLTAGLPVTTTNVTAATNVTLVPYLGDRMSLYNGQNWDVYRTLGNTVGLPAVANQVYDVFAVPVSGEVGLTFTAWTNDTTRATALFNQDGVLVKTGDLTSRYLGTVRTTAVAGQTEDSDTKRYLWNYYHRVRRRLRVLEATDSWTYTLNAFRQANASAANQVEVVVGVAEVLLTLQGRVRVSNSVATLTNVVMGIGEDSTVATVAGCLLESPQVGHVAGAALSTGCAVDRYPAIGRHFYAWLESSTPNNVTTWYGDLGVPGVVQSGLTGYIEG